MPTLGFIAKDSFSDLVDLVEASNNASSRRRFLSFNRSNSATSKRKREKFSTQSLPAGCRGAKCRENGKKESKQPAVVKFWKDGSDWKSCEYTIEVESFPIHDSKRRNGSQSSLIALKPPWNFCPPSDEQDEDRKECDDDFERLRNFASEKSETRLGGIVKGGSLVVPVCLGVEISEIKKFVPKTFQNHSVHSHRKVRFSPTLRIVPIRPLHAMKAEEKSNYWWQRQDFDHFKQEVFVLAKPQEDKTDCSRVLLLDDKQQEALQKRSKGKSKSKDSFEKVDTRSMKKALIEKEVIEKESMKKAIIEKEVIEKEWWHKYGDSRRGLEKFACAREYDQSVASIFSAIQKVLWEQSCMRRQRQCCSFFFGNNLRREEQDAERLARIYHEYTAWSRDLALAAAASDRDAVQTDFDDSKRKTREFFLLKQFFHHGRRVHKYMPQFMLPQKHGESSKVLKPEGFLDEHDSEIIPV